MEIKQEARNLALKEIKKFGIPNLIHFEIGEKWKLDGITLKIKNAIQALELAIKTNKKLWYEVFTITDDVPNVDLSKTKEVLGYTPV